MRIPRSARIVLVVIAALALSGVNGSAAGSSGRDGSTRTGVLQAQAHIGDRLPSQGRRNGGRIVWSVPVDLTFSSGHLVSAHADGSDFRQLTGATRGVNDFDASISPRGRRVVYERDTATSTEIRIRLVGPFDGPDAEPRSAVLYTAKPDGTDVKRLSPAGIDGLVSDAYARTVPGGNYYVFRRYPAAAPGAGLFRMDLDGARVRELMPYTSNADQFDLSPARSGPTKDLVLFQTHPDGETTSDLATVPATCTSKKDCADKVHFLTHNAGGSRRQSNPAWSPDGRWIVFTDRASVEAVHSEIWTMRYDGKHANRVSTSKTVLNYRPDWGPSPSCRTDHGHG
jgi:Tol biopolymer transport system component